MEIQWRRVQYGDTVEKGTVWGYSGEGYSMGIQWRRVQYGDTVEKGTVWRYSEEGYCMMIQLQMGRVCHYTRMLQYVPLLSIPIIHVLQQLKESQLHV